MAQPNQDIKHHEDAERPASPASSLSSGYGQAVGEFPVRDDRLPEVAPDTSPEVLSPLEADYKRRYLEHDAPQTAIDPEGDTHKIVVPAEHDSEALRPQMVASTAASAAQVESRTDKDPEGGDSFAHKEPTIFGLRRKLFIAIVIAVVVIIAAAVGGGVGGGIAASKHKSNSHTPDPATTSSSSPPTTSTSSTASPSRTASAAPMPTFLNNQTVPDDYRPAFQAFSGANYKGKASKAIIEEGGVDFGFEVHSYVWLPRITNCCVTFCQNATSEGMTGWRCPSRNQANATETFKRLFIWCSDDHSQTNAVCA
ncbi:hypothetical protein PT974_06998 [Cladobotryum mycophilum]|uniref:Uncharacterized protein n=1 Tax=Cladobotryum mycophilum TaxID=491253 RepID=A0ABR0SN26_9HYPO